MALGLKKLFFIYREFHVGERGRICAQSASRKDLCEPKELLCHIHCGHFLPFPSSGNSGLLCAQGAQKVAKPYITK